ncbi:rab guanine nucleotide exchange factor S2 [Neopestalotiopsis sp. 37M]|nr:rab guanine nucleotide exchange factor S2 [Neopestalotiopsis sp. 37M]
MDSFIHISAWTQHQSSSPKPQRPFGHLRSLSSFSQTSASSTREQSPARSAASPRTTGMSSPSREPSSLEVPHGPRRKYSNQSLADDEEFTTSPDPRKNSNGGTETPVHHPDLDDEVAALSTKLINAINHQTTLDDTLAATRQELEESNEKNRELEATIALQQEKLSGDVWIKKSTVEREKAQLLLRLAEERRAKAEVDREKKKIEQELENLTQALFEEANNMVIAAKEEAQREQDIVQRKNDLLKSQLADTEGLLRSQQEQLAELKLVMEQMTIERDDHSGTTPSSPGFSKFDSRDDDRSDITLQSAITEPCSPTFPTSLTHLLQPVLRTDLGAFDDFLALIKTSKSRPMSRLSNSSYGGLLSLASSGSAPSNASTASLATAITSSTSSQAPSTAASSLMSAASVTPLPPLKETKFFKRALAEDIEPTLRLDAAPGLSFLSRRSVLTSIIEGTMVVEPVPTNTSFTAITKPQFYPCSLCGESRRDAPHLRLHRFKTSEADSAQRYPLCTYCLNRVRSTCDFLGFLRIVKDGHWRADDADAERAAWEESVRLREQMFWSRIGGGVIPAIQANGLSAGSVCEKSPRTSHDAPSAVAESVRVPTPEPSLETSSDDTEATTKPVTIEEESADESQQPEAVGSDEPAVSTQIDDAQVEAIEESEPVQQSTTETLAVENTETDTDDIKRLSITIPGAFAA